PAMGTRFGEHGHRITMTCPGTLFRAIISMAQLPARGLPPDRRFHSPSRTDLKRKTLGPRHMCTWTLYTSGSKRAFGFAVPPPGILSQLSTNSEFSLTYRTEAAPFAVNAWKPADQSRETI